MQYKELKILIVTISELNKKILILARKKATLENSLNIQNWQNLLVTKKYSSNPILAQEIQLIKKRSLFKFGQDHESWHQIILQADMEEKDNLIIKIERAFSAVSDPDSHLSMQSK